MEEKKRHLELAVVKVEGDLVTFRIAEQTHRGDSFCEKGKIFEASNGYRIASVDILKLNDVSFYDIRKYLLVSGELYKGASCLFAEGKYFLRIMEAVTEYNETNGEGYEKPWPQKGDKYFCIYPDSTILEWNYTHGCTDEMRRSFGNFFRTREEAESARERVRKALKGVDENKLLREALEEAVAMYGKPGGPWNVPGDAGGWLDRARKALEVGNE